MSLKLPTMKHIDTTLPDTLAQALDTYVNDQEVPPSTAAVVQLRMR